MLFTRITVAVLFSSLSASAQNLTATELALNLNRLSDLTRVATAATQYAVYTDNPPENRGITVGAINAIGTQSTLDQDMMTGQSCGTLTKRQIPVYTLAEQVNITSTYATLVNVTEIFMGVCMEKHSAVVAHNAAHAMGETLNNTLSSLEAMTNTIVPMLSLKTDLITTQRDSLSQVYGMIVDLYVNGPA